MFDRKLVGRPEHARHDPDAVSKHVRPIDLEAAPNHDHGSDQCRCQGEEKQWSHALSKQKPGPQRDEDRRRVREQRRVGDRIGLILFADTAYVQAPLTYDRDTVSTLLSEAVIGLVGEQTAIGDAIGLAVKRFDEREESNNVLILLTDGQNTAGNITPEQAKELAISKGVKVYTIGVGADKMLIQSFFGSRQINPSQELDEGMLTDIATSTGGQYFRARNAQELQAIYQQLDALEPIEGETRKMRPLSALFYYPLGAAILLSALWAFLTVLLSTFRWFAQRRINSSQPHPNSADSIQAAQTNRETK